MGLATISIVIIFILFTLVMLVWFSYEIYGIRKDNTEVVDNFINTHKKKEEG